ncbi:MAG: phage minor head protein [Phycisphaerae bacterium]
MPDLAHKLTDEELTALERKIKREYERAGKEVAKRWKQFSAELKTEGDELLAAIKSAPDAAEKKLAGAKYGKWLKDKTLLDKRFTAVSDRIVSDLTKTNQLAASLMGERMNRVFALNHNFAAYELEHGLGLNLRFDLYDERTVARLLRDNPALLPKPKVDIPLDKLWNKSKINSAITQAILTGEPIDAIADRLQHVTDMNRRSAVNNARAAMTGAQNAGRLESYEYAQSTGIKLKKEWLATLDDRTREEHRVLDGQKVDIDEPFKAMGAEIMYPGDPDADGYMVYGCRCTMISDVEGLDELDKKYREPSAASRQTYSEWEASKHGG